MDLNTSSYLFITKIITLELPHSLFQKISLPLGRALELPALAACLCLCPGSLCCCSRAGGWGRGSPLLEWHPCSLGRGSGVACLCQRGAFASQVNWGQSGLGPGAPGLLYWAGASTYTWVLGGGRKLQISQLLLPGMELLYMQLWEEKCWQQASPVEVLQPWPGAGGRKSVFLQTPFPKRSFHQADLQWGTGCSANVTGSLCPYQYLVVLIESLCLHFLHLPFALSTISRSGNF